MEDRYTIQQKSTNLWQVDVHIGDRSDANEALMDHVIYDTEQLLHIIDQAGQGLLFIDLDDVANLHIDVQWLRCKLTSLTAEIPGSHAFVIAVDDRYIKAQPIEMPISTSVLHFCDYSAEQLMAILDQRLMRHAFRLTDEARQTVAEHVQRMCQSRNQANARTMRHIYTAITSAAELRCAQAKLQDAPVVQLDTPVDILAEDVQSFTWKSGYSSRIGFGD